MFCFHARAEVGDGLVAPLASRQGIGRAFDDDYQPVGFAPARRFPVWLMYGLAALVLLGAIVWATLGEISRNPARDVTTDFGPYGLITVRLTTDPNPPLPSGTVRVSVVPMDSRQRPVLIDSVALDYGREGETQAVGSVAAEPMADGSGMFIGGIVFGEVGDWWVRVRLAKGGEQAEATFRLYVEPAQ